MIDGAAPAIAGATGDVGLEDDDALEIRLAALQYTIPYFTTVEAAREALTGMVEMNGKPEQIYVLQETTSHTK